MHVLATWNALLSHLSDTLVEQIKVHIGHFDSGFFGVLMSPIEDVWGAYVTQRVTKSLAMRVLIEHPADLGQVL